jgi:hypothetical protein
VVDPFHDILIDVQRVSVEKGDRSHPNYHYEEQACSFEAPGVSVTSLFMIWLGKCLVSWGNRLQDRYDVEAPQPSLTFLRR